MEIEAKPLGAGGAAKAQTQTPVSQEVLAARLCEMSANMENVVGNTKTMVKQMGDSAAINADMLSQMAKAAEDNAELGDKMTELVQVSQEALKVQAVIVEKTEHMSASVDRLVDRIGTMLDVTDKNMTTLSMNTAAIIASTTTPREEGEALKDWRMRIYVETLAMFEIAEEQRKTTMKKAEPDA